MLEVGLRVTRGPDWKWGNQDDGEGHIGTVVEIGKPGSSTSPDKTVVVQWDSGSRTNYRVGYQGKYDLRVLDNAPVGVKHPNIICDICKTQGISGMRWKCTKCLDYDLCTDCYMNDKHDLGHAFLRLETFSSKGVKMPKRKDTLNSTKVRAQGLINGARVVRGPDWDWGNQDGGEGKIGKITEIRGWDSESERSVSNVAWQTGSTNVYRVGHKGKVDLKYVTAGQGIYYYKEHLPVLGEFSDSVTQSGVACPFKVGEKVQVDLDPEILKAMQEGHGGWNPRMADYIGKVGVVHRITDRGDVRVQYEGCSNRWTFHAGALTKVHAFRVNDQVKVSHNIHLVKEKQKGHGEWSESMRAILGKQGRVISIYPDGDLRVTVNGNTYTLNPICCTVPSQEPDVNNTDRFPDREHSTSMQTLLDHLKEPSLSIETGPDRLVRESAQGHTEIVKDIVTKHPDKVDLKSAGKTALQVACHQGHKDIVQILLDAGANLELQDDDGDTALHYSAFGYQAEIMEMLLRKGAQINSLNNGGCSSLHVAVNKQHLECAKILLRYKCNVNIQDSYGDTCLHDAIGKENRQIIDMLVCYNGIDFTLRNKRGFNVLHHAALKGNSFATEKILLKCRQIVDIKKDDGFSAVHLAGLNGHKDVTNVLLTQGQADIEIRNNRQQTPLLLAVSQGHTSIIELLVTRGADINVKDEDGDTCLHVALMRQSVPQEREPTPMLEAICNQLGMADDEDQMGAAIACYLAQQGASLTHKNNQGKTPLEVCGDPKVEEMIKQFTTAQASKSDPQTSSEKDSLVQECMVCSENMACIKFSPCGHVITCFDCCQKMRKCISCKENIDSKTCPDGSEVTATREHPAAGVMESNLLQKKLQEMEENFLCSICMERKRNMAFLCGHTVCNICGDSLRTCHMCRKPITKKIPLYA
ncbi:E3 ubiquitin-protein ligase mind-bomb [Mytilus galloprovincialis]|uniref:RING-type E3 ubiquitin transferase n=3 Tax=Mytilus galloprovincialis TaxID=29158 RepID=A0A8B6C4L8_MYTGA|nr:E3 ubiquitin-protein ligase mind-bomb [Mytilus galloprovincialis]